MLNGLGSLRVRVSAEDLAGVWSEGEVLSKRELYERTKRRILEKRYNESSRFSGGDGS
jgi:hypothetical protein